MVLSREAHKQESRPGWNRSGVFGADLEEFYLVILYVRSPAVFLEDSMLWPPLLPRMLTKPRTVCFCQPVVSMISASVAPLARFIIAITSAFLLLRSETLISSALWDTFFAGLAFLAAFPALRGASGFGAAGSSDAPFPASG